MSHPIPTTSSAISALRREWAAIAATPVPWASDLTTAATIGELVEQIPSSAHQDRLLHQLLTRHHDGDDLAGRVLLQVMLPRAQRLTRTTAARGHDGDDAVLALWSAIALYPLHRTEHVAANVAMDALRYLSPSGGDITVEDSTLEALMHDEQDAARAEHSTPSPSDEAIAVLLWALDHDVLSREDVQLLAATHLGDGWRNDSALPEGMSAQTARQRRSRATRALAQAVHATL